MANAENKDTPLSLSAINNGVSHEGKNNQGSNQKTTQSFLWGNQDLYTITEFKTAERFLAIEKIFYFLFLVWSFILVMAGFVFFAIFGFLPNIRLTHEQISTFLIFSLSIFIVWAGLAGLCMSIKFFNQQTKIIK